MREVEGQVLGSGLPDFIEEGFVERDRDLRRHVDDPLGDDQTQLENFK